MPAYAARIMRSIPPAASAGPRTWPKWVDNDRSGFVTGANFVIDGGMTRKMIYEPE